MHAREAMGQHAAPQDRARRCAVLRRDRVVGTPRVVVDATGAIVKRIERDAFERVITDSAPGFFLPIGFTGGLEDPATGLVRLGARDYELATGRFTARDPLLHDSFELNLFVYGDNAPTSMRDPRGLWSRSFGGCAFGCFDFKVSWDLDTGRWGYCSGVGVGTPQMSFGVNPLGKIDTTGAYAYVQAGMKFGVRPGNAGPQEKEVRRPS